MGQTQTLPCSGTILTHEGQENEAVLREVPVLLYYFSAHWCPPCRQFTPILAQLYKKWNENGKRVEIVFVSSDQSLAQFQEYFAEMPWVALPFGDGKGQHLASMSKFNVWGIPNLCIASNDGNDTLLSKNAIDDIMRKGEKALDDWEKLYVKK